MLHTKWAWETVLIIGCVLWQVIGIPVIDESSDIFLNVVNPGVLTISGWIISTLPLSIKALYSNSL